MPRYLKEILLGICLLLLVPEVYARLAGIGGITAQIAYIGLLALMLGAIAAAAYTPYAVLRWLMAAVLAGSTYFLDVFERVTTQFMSYEAFINMMNSAAFAGDAFSQSRSAFIAAAGPAALLLVAIGLRPHWRFKMPGPLLAAGPWLGAGLLTGILFLRGGDGAKGLPDAFTPIAYFALSEYENMAGDLGPRQAVKLPLADAPPRRNIVLIVDESIAGAYLDINSPAGVATPLSRAWPGIAQSVGRAGGGNSVTPTGRTLWEVS